MSGATFSRIKNWNPEILTNTDLNAEIDNILNHLDPTGVGDYSDTAAMMRLQTDPGGLNSESLATSLAGELERLRFVIKRLIGTSATYWYETPLSSITDIVSVLGSTLFNTRIISGRTTGNSSQLCALIPAGNTASIVLSASVTPFIYCVNGQNVTISTNKTISGLSLASASNNTASGDTLLYSGAPIWTKSAGQYGNRIVINTVGSGFSNATGSFVAAKNIQGGSTEYFLTFVENGTAFTNTWRGCFFDSSANGIAAQNFSGNTTTFNLMKLTWIFADVNGSLQVTYTNPFIGAIQPTSPAIGDYWFDLGATAWKTFTSTTWAGTNSLLIGMCVQDTTACQAARTFDSYAAADSLQTMTLDANTNTTIRERGMFSQVNVFGSKINFGPTKTVWDTALHLDTSTTLSVNTPYFMYLKENGAPLISDTAPQFRREFQGFYHPRETWRAIGSAWTDGNTAFATPLRTFRGQQAFMLVTSPDAYLVQANISSGQTLPYISPDRFIRQNSSNGTAAFPGASNAWADFTTLSLTPGLWSVSAMAEFQVTNGTPPASLFGIGISVNGTASFSDRKVGYNAADGAWNNITYSITAAASATLSATITMLGQAQTLTIPDCWMEVKTAQSIYLKCICASIDTTKATYQVNGWGINARRIDDIIGGAN